MTENHSLGYGPLAERTVSAFPLSIGTSLAFESLFKGRLDPYGPEREIPETYDITKYNEMWIHVGTLFRNIVGAMTKEGFLDATVEELRDALYFEMEMITSILSTEGMGVCKPMFYFCSYDDVYTKRHHAGVQLRRETTDKQKAYKAKYLKTLGLMKDDIQNGSILLLDSDLRPKSNNTRALIITHFAYDLLSWKRFGVLDLLETHTGILKSRHLWYSKYYKGKDLSNLPFQRKLLYIFGDSEIFHPMDIRFRRNILEIAAKSHWTPMTTEDKVGFDLDNQLRDRYMYELFRSL